MWKNVCVLNAEELFLPHLRSLHARFPALRIVLEHATTRAAVEAVKSLGETVACTITAHHLALTVDDWAGQSFNFCKPVAKFPDDRRALHEIIQEGEIFKHRHQLIVIYTFEIQAILAFSLDLILRRILPQRNRLPPLGMLALQECTPLPSFSHL